MVYQLKAFKQTGDTLTNNQNVFKKHCWNRKQKINPTTKGGGHPCLERRRYIQRLTKYKLNELFNGIKLIQNEYSQYLGVD